MIVLSIFILKYIKEGMRAGTLVLISAEFAIISYNIVYSVSVVGIVVLLIKILLVCGSIYTIYYFPVYIFPVYKCKYIIGYKEIV